MVLPATCQRMNVNGISIQKKSQLLMRFKLLTLLLVLALNALGQKPKIDTAAILANLNSAADKMKKSFAEKDFVTFCNYIPPEIVKKAGGKDKLIELTRNSLKEMEEQGFKIMSMTVDTPQKIINNQNNLQTIIQQNLTLKTKDGHMVVKAYLVALSRNMGKTWYFVDTSNMSLNELKSIFPFLSNKLIIPEKEQPKIYRE
jgi:hypothetical protein